MLIVLFYLELVNFLENETLNEVILFFSFFLIRYFRQNRLLLRCTTNYARYPTWITNILANEGVYIYKMYGRSERNRI